MAGAILEGDKICQDNIEQQAISDQYQYDVYTFLSLMISTNFVTRTTVLLFFKDFYFHRFSPRLKKETFKKRPINNSVCLDMLNSL